MNARGRIDGIDFWRGIALLTIFINHVPDSVLSDYTHKNFGFSDAAEAFVFLSGISVALAYGSYFIKGEIGGGIRAVARRAFKLYWVQVLLSFLVIVLFAAAAVLLDDDDLTDDEDRELVVAHPVRAIIAILGLTHQLDFINILPLYIVLLLATPALLALARVNGWLMLGASATIYVTARVLDLNLPTWPLEGSWFFNPLTWQFLFAIGLFLGLRLKSEPDRPAVPFDIRLFATCAIGLALAAFAMTNGFGRIPHLWDGVHASIDVGKSDLGAMRFIHFLALAYVVCYSGLTWLLRATFAFKPVSLMGRYSLPVFATGSILAAIAQVIDEAGETLADHIWLGLLIVAIGILVHYLVARVLQARADAPKKVPAVALPRPRARIVVAEPKPERQRESLQVS